MSESEWDRWKIEIKVHVPGMEDPIGTEIDPEGNVSVEGVPLTPSGVFDLFQGIAKEKAGRGHDQGAEGWSFGVTGDAAFGASDSHRVG